MRLLQKILHSPKESQALPLSREATDVFDRSEQHTTSDAVFQIGINVTSMIAFCGISGIAYLLWCLVAPYATGVISAVLFSVVIHFRKRESSRQDNDAVANSQLALRAWRQRRARYLVVLDPVVGIPRTIAAVVPRTFFVEGIELLPFLERHKHPMVQSCVTYSLLLGIVGVQLSWAAVLVVVAVPMLCTASTAWCQRAAAIRWTRHFTTASMSIAIAAAVVWSMKTEGQHAYGDVQTLGRYVQSLGVTVPTNLTAALDGAVSRYVPQQYSEMFEAAVHAVELLREATTQKQHEFWRVLDSIRSGDFQLLHSIDVTHSPHAVALTQLSKEAVDQLQSTLRLVAAVVLSTSLALATAAWDTVYEMLLFVFVLRWLLGLQQSLVHIVLLKFQQLAAPNQNVAQQRADEQADRLLELMSNLLTAYWKVFLFNFISTYWLLSAVGCRYKVSFGFVSAFFAVLPVGVFPCLPCVCTGLSTVWSGDMVSGSLLIGCTGIVFFGLSAHASAMDVSASRSDADLVAKAAILGFVSFGVRGVAIGPIAIIAARAMWDGAVFEHSQTPSQGRHDAEATKEKTKGD